MSSGIRSYGAYVPRRRLDLAEVTENGRGARIVASFDEDSTTMSVAAAFAALRDGDRPGALWFATTSPAYVDKTNATALHAALFLPMEVGAYDLGASWRSAVAALRAASMSDGLADVRVGRPGGADERVGAGAAAAFLFGVDDVIAEPTGAGSASAEFLDRWANPGDISARSWEERFSAGVYLPLAERATDDALKSAGVTVEDLDGVVVAGPNPRAVRSAIAMLRGRAGLPPAEPLPVGDARTAALGLAMADALDRAAPVDPRRRTGRRRRRLHPPHDEPAAHPARLPVRATLGAGIPVGYPTYLSWRGLLDREPPRRPPSAPFTARNAGYKFGFTGGRCREPSPVPARPATSSRSPSTGSRRPQARRSSVR